MKTSNVIVSLFFGSLAAAVPVKRDLHTKTELVVETVVVFTTVWDDGSAPTVATTTAGAFYEQPSKAASSAAKTTATSTYVASVVQSPSSVYIAPTSTASPQPQSTTSAYTPPAAPTSQAAAAPASVYTPPSPVSSAPAATSLSASTGSTGGGETYSGGDLTVYNTGGGKGSCSKGESLSDNGMTVAVPIGTIGGPIYDPATGYPMMEMCGKKVAITLNGKTVEATIEDTCGGCENPNSLDLTPAVWYALLGDGHEFTRITPTMNPWSWKVIG